MNDFTFYASTINCVTDCEVLIIGIGDDDIEPENYIILSYLDGDEDGVDIESSRSVRHQYDAIESIEIKDRVITLVIKEDKIEIVGFRTAIIEYNPEEIDEVNFFLYLNQIFTDSGIKFSIS
ncbi:MAG: hypothetical protein LUE98_05660 [Tannerellaceae bacterium]|nr:hypothetical protein [Tannerellaceae bacterium]